MDILILDSWLREFLETNATSYDIARCLSLCGPSIEKTEKVKISGKLDFVYHIEVTTNRVDMMSVYGIAREGSVILPEFGFKAKLINPTEDSGINGIKNTSPIKFIGNPKLVYRMIGVVMEIDKIAASPKIIADRLISSGIRSLNNIVDITNYVMTEIGHPTHVFDYDLIKPSILVRESKKGERVTSFDGKEYVLPGGDIVFENTNHEIIDLPGIIGTKNSVVNENTKRILFFIDTNNAVNIRKTSMTLGIRTVAATLNEKGVDPILAELALKRGIYLYKKYSKAKQIGPIIDLFSQKSKDPTITLNHNLLEKKLGIKILPERTVKILNSLQIKTTYDKKSENYSSQISSFRRKDILIPEGLIEEVARIYGYHNLPSKLMNGELQQNLSNNTFDFEMKLKRILTGFAGNEVYTLSLVPSAEISGKKALQLKNPLGGDTEYLRISLMPSLSRAANDNLKISSEPFHLFEIANVYEPVLNKLPNEKMTLAGIFANYDFRKAKGVIEALLDKLNIKYKQKPLDKNGFMANSHIIINDGKLEIGNYGVLDGSNLIYYEFDTKLLESGSKQYRAFVDIPKFPAQIEDLTLTVPERTIIGDVLDFIKSFNKNIKNVELNDIYQDSYTFRIRYANDEKTLENKEVQLIRNSLISNLTKKFGTSVK